MNPHARVVVARAALAALSLLCAHRRPPLTPVAVALFALAALDAAYLAALGWPGAARLALAVWLAWPGVSSALSWRVYRAPSDRRWLLVALLFGTYAALAATAAWGGHPQAYALALQAPYWTGPALSLVAWATRPSPGSGARAPEAAPAATRRVAALLAWSGFLDVAVGALAEPNLPWWLAHTTTAMTLGLVAGVLLLEVRAQRA